MRKTIRRTLLLALCTILCASLFTVTALADDDPVTGTFESFEYTVDGNTITITACDKAAEGKVTIPASIDKKKVTALGPEAFAGCDKITEVVIPNGVKTIGKGCFRDCALTKISLPASVETVGAGAFACKTLTSVSVNKNNKKFSSAKGILFNKKQTTLVCYPAAKTGSYTLPKTVKKISSRAFAGSGLTTLTLDSKGKLATIGEAAFAGSSLTGLTVPKTVTSLGADAFANCASLESVKLSAAITELPEGVFSGCEALTSVTLPKKLKSVGARAFAGCAALPGVTLPDDVTVIPEALFEGCAALDGVKLHNHTSSIGERAFAGSGLRSISIPATVTQIGAQAFAECANLREIVFDHDDSEPLTIGEGAFAGSVGATTVRVPKPDAPAGFLSAYPWGDDGRAVTYDQNMNIAVRTVKLVSAVNAFGGVQLRWDPMEKAEDYVVLRKAPDAEEWGLVGVAPKSPYVDTSASSGKEYLYTVQAESEGFYSKYDPSGIRIRYIASPVLSQIYNNYAGVVISWPKVGGAGKYRIFRHTDNADWTALTDTTANSYTDRSVVIGRRYTYTVCCVSDDGQEVLSSRDPKGLSIVYYPLATPNGLSLSADNGGVHFSWNAVNDTPKYRVFRKTGNGGWVMLGDTTAAKFTDTSAAIGTTYTYTVRCVSADGNTFLSDYNRSGVSLRRAGVPSLSSVENVESGVEIQWKAASGAVRYRVFRKVGSGNWQRVGETTGTSLTDKSAKSGTKYAYTVRCVTGDSKFFAGDYDHTGKVITYVAAPSVQSVVGGNGGVEIKWGGVKGAAKYRVFRREGSGSWQKLGDVGGTSFVDGSAVAGHSYTYTVRCLDSGGNYASAYRSGRSIKFLATPSLQSAQSVSGGVQVRWGKVGGAAKYRLFRKTGSGGWQKVADTTGTSFVDKGVKKNTTYTYTVRCLSSGGVYVSGYNGAGLTVTYTG